jgi:hypothetical protein
MEMTNMGVVHVAGDEPPFHGINQTQKKKQSAQTGIHLKISFQVNRPDI